jgi:hypothetical protein
MENQNPKWPYFLIAGFVVGAMGFFMFNWQEMPPADRHRTPAQSFDESEFAIAMLNRSQLIREFSARLLPVKNPPIAGVEYSEINVTNKDGKSLPLCDRFSEIEIEFSAEGVAVSGELPTMTVSGPCEGLSLLVNASKLPQTVVAEFEWPPDSELQTTASISGASDSWPKFWAITEITFQGQNEADTVSFSREQMPSSDLLVELAAE